MFFVMAIKFKLETELDNEFSGIVTVYGLPKDDDRYHYLIGGKRSLIEEVPSFTKYLGRGINGDFSNYLLISGLENSKRKLKELPKDKMNLMEKMPSRKIDSFLTLGFLWYLKNYNEYFGEEDRKLKNVEIPEGIFVYGDVPTYEGNSLTKFGFEKKTPFKRNFRKSPDLNLPFRVGGLELIKKEEEIFEYIEKRCDENYRKGRILSLPTGEIYNFADPTERNYDKVDLSLVSLFEREKIKETPDGRIFVKPKSLAHINRFPSS